MILKGEMVDLVARINKNDVLDLLIVILLTFCIYRLNVKIKNITKLQTTQATKIQELNKEVKKLKAIKDFK